MDLSAPVGPEPVGDLSEDDRRADFLLTDVVVAVTTWCKRRLFVSGRSAAWR
jgi:hypothetical protein